MGSSEIAGMTMARPLQISGSSVFFSAWEPPAKPTSAAKTPDEKQGPGSGARPNSSNTTAQSVQEAPAPPYFSGSIIPSQPTSAVFLYSSGRKAIFFWNQSVITYEGASAFKKSAATFFIML